MLVPFRRALLSGAVATLLLAGRAAEGKDVFKASLDPAIPHHAAILDTLARLEASPSDANLHNDLGCLVAWDGFWRDALRSFDAASELAPKDSKPRFNAGLVEGLRGNWRGARSRFRSAVKVDPGNWPAWWMLGFSEEMLGNGGAAAEAYGRSLRVDTSLFDPKVNPFAAASRMKWKVLLETLNRRRVDAALPYVNQLEEPARLASFFQARPKAEKATVQIEEPPKTGPIVTTVPPAMAPRPAATVVPLGDPMSRRRRAYSDRAGRDPDAPVEVAPEAARPVPAPEPAPAPAPGPGFGEGSGAPGTGAVGTTPAVTTPPRRVPAPGPGGPPEPSPDPE
jgi:hypothetical protein